MSRKDCDLRLTPTLSLLIKINVQIISPLPFEGSSWKGFAIRRTIGDSPLVFDNNMSEREDNEGEYEELD
jgi:hypothetical protein